MTVDAPEREPHREATAMGRVGHVIGHPLRVTAIAKDTATLAKIYSDDVTYSHSSALNQNKAEVLKAFQGTGVTESLKFSDTTIRIYGTVALFKGVTDMRNGQPGKLVDNHLNILWVLVKGPGPYGWQIVARQTTRYPEPAAAAPARTTSSR